MSFLTVSLFSPIYVVLLLRIVSAVWRLAFYEPLEHLHWHVTRGSLPFCSYPLCLGGNARLCLEPFIPDTVYPLLTRWSLVAILPGITTFHSSGQAYSFYHAVLYNNAPHHCEDALE